MLATSAAACSAAHGGSDGFDASDSGATNDVSNDDAQTGPVADADIDAGTALLAQAPNCPLSMFASGTAAEDFSSDASVGADWAPNWVAPVPNAGSLRFGPHPMNENWWENYSPTTSTSKPGDVLVCARLRISADPEADAGAVAAVDAGDTDGASSNTFEITVRLPDDAGFETSGMALQMRANDSKIVLHTRTGSDTWITHDSAPFAFAASSITTVDVAIFAQGSRFFAQARNVDTGDVATLHATYDMPAGGAVNLLGWRERGATFVDRMVIGVPAASTLPALN
ncbi:MAG TPA: hypothetical protein VF407_11075 [Polyangiaceae bacterium]